MSGKKPVLTKTPVWQALAVLGWARDIFLAEVLPPGAKDIKACELHCKKGVDLGKWQRNQVAYLHGTEPRPDLCEYVKKAAKNLKMTAEFSNVDVFRDDFSGELPSSAFDCVAMFNDTHLMMESAETLRLFMSNLAFLLKPGGFFVGQMHDGAALWYALQKEVPEANIPDDYEPHFRRTLFSVSAPKVITDHLGAAYQFKVRKEEKGTAAISLKIGYLINSTQLYAAASEVGLEVVHMINASEVLDLYSGVYGESLKKKATTKNILKEQREVLDMYAFCVIRKPEE